MNLIKQIYDALTAPLYNRLVIELKSALQIQLQTQLDSQGILLEQVLDELSSINLRLDEVTESPAELSAYLKQRDDRLAEIECKLSSETIYSVITELRKERGVHNVVHKYEISASAAIQLDCKYHGMNAGAIERLRQAVKQRQTLEEELNRIQAYKAVETIGSQL